MSGWNLGAENGGNCADESGPGKVTPPTTPFGRYMTAIYVYRFGENGNGKPSGNNAPEHRTGHADIFRRVSDSAKQRLNEMARKAQKGTV